MLDVDHYRRNSNGPKIEPCGTPHLTFKRSVLFILSYWMYCFCTTEIVMSKTVIGNSDVSSILISDRYLNSGRGFVVAKQSDSYPMGIEQKASLLNPTKTGAVFPTDKFLFKKDNIQN